MKTLIFLSFTILSAALTACQKTKVDPVAEGEKLMQVSREWSQTVPTKDYEKMLSYWRDDAVIIMPNQAPIKGKEAIRAMVESTSKNPAFNISWEPIEAHISDDASMGYLIERNKVTLNDSLTAYHNVITVWRKTEDGTWKNVADVSTPDTSRN